MTRQPAPPRRGRRNPGRGRPGPRRREPAGARGSLLPYLLALAVCAGGLIWVSRGGAHGVQGGTLAVAGAMLIAALARLVLPESRVGMLASRTRTTDVVTLCALAGGLLVTGLMLRTLP
jgi:hypothetical protein